MSDPSAGMRWDPAERKFQARWRARVTALDATKVRAEEWVRFIKGLHDACDFQWFTTLTFRNPTHPESAVKAYEKWQHHLNRKIYGVRYYRRAEGISSVVAIEYQRRGVLHFHALNSGVRVPAQRQGTAIHDPEVFSVIEGVAVEMRRFYAMDLWNTMAGYARIFPFRASGGAEAYVAKYVCKGGDIFLMGRFTPNTPSLAVMSPMKGGIEVAGA